MTEESSASIDEVRTLVAERLRFDEWLEALEGRRESTPDHVFERVHGDYVARRTAVMEELHGHVPDLEGSLADLDGRAESLAVRCKAEEDERAEAMLRHAVGEYDDAKWDEVRQRVESTLAILGGEAEAIEEQRKDVRSLLESARPDSAAEQAELDAAVAAESAATGGTSASGNASESTTAEWLGALTPADSPADTSGPVAGESSGESARLASDTSTDDASDETGHAGGAPAGDAVAESGGAAAAGAGTAGAGTAGSGTADQASGSSDDRALPSDDDLELSPEMPARPTASGNERPRIWGTPASSAVSASTSRDRSADADAEDVFGDARSEGADAAGRSGSVTKEADAVSSAAKPEAEFDELAFLRSVIEPEGEKPSLPRAPAKSEEQKTLRCTECSTMNLPTEWYCERCGGELAAF